MYKSLKSYYKHIFGFNLYTLKMLTNKIESFNGVAQDNYLHKYNESLYLDKFLINNWSFKNKIICNIYLMELLGIYKGWRHSRGLPVRGQRTWSNSWSSYRSNTLLRSYKIEVAKRLYGENFSKDYFVAYLAEEVNRMWKSQWEKEWYEAKQKRIKSTKNVKNLPKIDLVAMSKLQLGQTSNNNKKNSKRKIQKKNVFTLGFDPGFTKDLMKKGKLT